MTYPPPPPPPSYGSPMMPPPGPTGGQLASWGQRVVAVLIEAAMILVGYIVVLVIVLILGSISSTLGVLVGVLGYIAVAAAGLYFAYLTGATGQSPGKRLTGLVVIGETTGAPIGGGAGIGRALLHIIDGIPCYVGYLWPLWDPKRQTFADKLIKTVVLTGGPKQSIGPNLFK